MLEDGESPAFCLLLGCRHSRAGKKFPHVRGRCLVSLLDVNFQKENPEPKVKEERLGKNTFRWMSIKILARIIMSEHVGVFHVHFLRFLSETRTESSLVSSKSH